MCLERKGGGERNAVYEAEEGVQRGRGEGSWEPWHSMLAATSHVPETTPIHLHTSPFRRVGREEIGGRLEEMLDWGFAPKTQVLF